MEDQTAKEWIGMPDEGVEDQCVFEQTEAEPFVEVMFAKSPDEAESCCTILTEHEIPARVEDGRHDLDLGISVLVPHLYLDQASELLALRAQLAEEGPETDDQTGEEEFESDDDYGYDDDMDEDEDDDDLDDDSDDGGDDEDDDFDDDDDDL